MSEYASRMPKTLSTPGRPDVIGVSIVNYFSHASVKLLLDSLRVFSHDCNVIVTIVDNSQDFGRQEAEILRIAAALVSDSQLNVEVIEAKGNLGYGAGNNFGVSRLIERGATLLWVLNPDTVVHGSASSLAREVRSSADTIWSTVTKENGIVSHGIGKLNTLSGRAGASSRTTVGFERFSMRYPGGHSIVFSMEAWHQLRGFDEDYFLFMEEADLALRARELELAVGTLSSVTVYHDQGLTTGSTQDLRSKSDVAFSEATTSRIIFFKKFYPRRLPILLGCRLIYMAIILLKGNFSGARAVGRGIRKGLLLALKRKGQSHEE